MPFRSARFWLGLCASPLLFSQAQAAVTVAAEAPYGIGSSNSVMWVTSNSAVQVDTGNNPAYKNLSLTASVADSSVASNAYLEFNVSADDGFTVTDQLVVTLYARKSGSTDYAKAPIGYREEVACDGVSCQVDTGIGYLAARYGASDAKTALKVGIFLRDVCAYGVAAGTAFEGCTGSAVTSSSSGNPNVMYFKFVVGAVASTDVATINSQPTSNEVQLKINVDKPMHSSCPDLSEAYFPGDGEIFFDALIFANRYSQASSVPVSSVLVIAKQGATPTLADNTIRAALSISQGSQSIEGFLNTTNGSDNTYNLKIAYRDEAGTLSDFGCSISNVQTSAVLGFVNNSNCFIATAAFGDGNSWPVRLLREFRDKVLARSGVGAAFVNWYYRWSPDAALWLERNPAFRVPILFALVPIQAMAWLVLNPVAALTLFAVSFGALMVFFVGRRRSLRRGVA